MDVNPPFEMDNRSKRSIVLDLRTEEGRAAALDLLAGADVFLTNVRPAALQRLGLDYETISARNPRLVYGLLTGYGTSGPDADKAAYDVAAYWARSGIASLLSRPGEPPPFQRSGMGDHLAGMNLAAGICAALYAREQTGAGQLVTTSLYRTGAYTVSFDLNMFLLTGQPIAIGQRDTMRSPTDEQLRSRRRTPLLDRRARDRTPLACAMPRRGSPGMARRRAISRCPVSRSQRHRADRRVGRHLRNEITRRLGGDLRDRTRVLLVTDQHDRGRHRR